MRRLGACNQQRKTEVDGFRCDLGVVRGELEKNRMLLATRYTEQMIKREELEKLKKELAEVTGAHAEEINKLKGAYPRKSLLGRALNFSWGRRCPNWWRRRIRSPSSWTTPCRGLSFLAGCTRPA